LQNTDIHGAPVPQNNQLWFTARMDCQPSLIILMGLKHSGKSTLSKLVASNLQLPCLDLDEIISELAIEQYPELVNFGNHPEIVRSLYRQHGKNVFQEFETSAARHLVEAVASKSGSVQNVVALGGGTMENETAMLILKPVSLVLFIDPPCDVLFNRIMKSGIPAFLDPTDPEGSFRKIFEMRRPLALRFSDAVISVNQQNPHQVLDSILKIIKEQLNVR